MKTKSLKIALGMAVVAFTMACNSGKKDSGSTDSMMGSDTMMMDTSGTMGTDTMGTGTGTGSDMGTGTGTGTGTMGSDTASTQTPAP